MQTEKKVTDNGHRSGERGRERVGKRRRREYLSSMADFFWSTMVVTMTQRLLAARK